MPHFAKRHYQAIAQTMQEAHPGAALSKDNRAVMQWESSIVELAKMFGRDNSKFQQNRFLCACQPGNNVRARS